MKSKQKTYEDSKWKNTHYLLLTSGIYGAAFSTGFLKVDGYLYGALVSIFSLLIGIIFAKNQVKNSFSRDR